MYIHMHVLCVTKKQHKTGQSAPQWLCRSLADASLLFTVRLNCHPVVIVPSAVCAMPPETDMHQHPSKGSILTGKWYSHVRIFLRCTTGRALACKLVIVSCSVLCVSILCFVWKELICYQRKLLLRVQCTIIVQCNWCRTILCNRIETVQNGNGDWVQG